MEQYWDHKNFGITADLFSLDPNDPQYMIQFDVVRAVALQNVYVNLHIIDEANSSACSGGASTCTLPQGDTNTFSAVFNTDDPDFQDYYGGPVPDRSLFPKIFSGQTGLVDSYWTAGTGASAPGVVPQRYPIVGNFLVLAQSSDEGFGTTTPGRWVSASDFVDRGDGILIGPDITLQFIKIIHAGGSFEILAHSDADDIADDADNTPFIYNPDQLDVDDDGLADVINPCPADPTDACDTTGSAAGSHWCGGRHTCPGEW